MNDQVHTTDESAPHLYVLFALLCEDINSQLRAGIANNLGVGWVKIVSEQPPTIIQYGHNLVQKSHKTSRFSGVRTRFDKAILYRTYISWDLNLAYM